MTAAIIVQPEAEADRADAFGWYERRQPGLGRDFPDEIDRTFTRIAEQPLLAAFVWREARRVLPRRFPYVVLYVAHGETVHVLGVLHQRRDPNLFQTRVRGVQTG